ncbi:RHS repeat-associated core domain-containing protein [Pseudomonas sp. Z3-8]|uniref:RHS repeat-associated core domain-containing protein n=1 Tax=Pseudomonas sp. Z3-8 TaxID=2817412 RepID=UPI003DA9C377
MSKIQLTLLCQYHYDPLDRLADCTVPDQASARRFYVKGRVSNEIQGQIQRSVVQHGDQLLAQQLCQGGTVETTLLATDRQRSVLQLLDPTQPDALAYTPYGHHVPANGFLSLLGFNGERPDPVTGHYLLGNGYRAFNPVLMRFNGPDSWSPFGKGGLNAYTYCLGDPINHRDPSGHVPAFMKGILRSLGLMPPQTHPPVPVARSVSQRSLLSTEAPEARLPRALDRPSSDVVPGSSAQPSRLGREEIAEMFYIDEELPGLQYLIGEGNTKYGAITLNPKLDPDAYHQFMDFLELRDELLDRINELRMRAGETPDYNTATGLPRYTSALARQKKLENSAKHVRTVRVIPE